MQIGVLHEAQQSCEILARTMVQPCTRMSWKNSRVSSAPGWSPVVAPQMAMVPPGRTDFIEWLQVPRHGFDHRIDLARQAGTDLQRGVRAKFQRFGALVRVTRGDEHFQTGGMGELDGRSGHAAARALNEHGVARLDAGGIEQQRVGGQPAGCRVRASAW